MIIAVDGTTASGKGTLSKRLAARYGLAYLDTGSLYRAVGASALRRGVPLDAREDLAQLARTLDPGEFEEHDLRTAEAGQAASKVAAIPEVRIALLEYQRAFASQPGGAILDGRDIGTVVCPDADVKFWVDAALPVRAERRWKELTAKGASLTLDEMVADLQARDARDRGRDVSPMKPADDAHLLETTDLTIEAAVETAVAIIEGARKKKTRRFWGLFGSKSKAG